MECAGSRRSAICVRAHSRSCGCHSGLARKYSEIVPAIEQFRREHDGASGNDVRIPDGLLEKPMHLDPDFGCLTYGDEGARRGIKIKELCENDLLVFYAGLRPVFSSPHRLLYSLIGLFTVQRVVLAKEIPKDQWHENAHVRKKERSETDIVVRAKPGCSGRFERCIPIGEWRDRAYRVRKDILEAWGGLSVKDGFIQRSVNPPEFNNPEKFFDWFEQQSAHLLVKNN